MSSASEKTVIRARTPPASLRLVQWPLRDEPSKSGVVLGFILLISVVSGVVVKRAAMGALIFALLALTVYRLWWPNVYEFGTKGIVWSRWGRKRRIAWSDIGRLEFHDDGVLICGDRERQPFSSLRSLFIRWNGRRDELLPILEFYLSLDSSAARDSTQTYQR